MDWPRSLMWMGSRLRHSSSPSVQFSKFLCSQNRSDGPNLPTMSSHRSNTSATEQSALTKQLHRNFRIRTLVQTSDCILFTTATVRLAPIHLDACLIDNPRPQCRFRVIIDKLQIKHNISAVPRFPASRRGLGSRQP